jgi:hypothetical protein
MNKIQELGGGRDPAATSRARGFTHGPLKISRPVRPQGGPNTGGANGNNSKGGSGALTLTWNAILVWFSPAQAA